MADQNSIPSNLPIEEKKIGQTSPPPSPGVGGPVSLPNPTPLSVNSYPKPVEKPTISFPVSNSVPPPPVPDSRPIKSYIRTMDSDIKSLQAGQAPRGMEKSLPAVISAEAFQPAGGQNVTPGAAPQSAPVVEIKLSKPEGGVSMPSFSKKEEVKITVNAPQPAPQIVIPPPPAVPRSILPTFNKPESRPTPPLPAVSSRSVLPPAPPTRPGTQVLPSPSTKPETKPVIVPPSKATTVSTKGLGSFVGPKMLILGGILVLLVAAGFGYWWFILNAEDRDNIFVSPSPSASVAVSVQSTPLPRVSKLVSFFPIHRLLPIGQGQGKTLTSVLPDITLLKLSNSDKNILLDPRSESGEDYTFSKFLERFLINFPVNFSLVIDESDFDLIWSIQKEKFSVQGEKIASNSGLEDRRLALAVRVTNAEQARKMMLEWEESMTNDWQNLFVFPAQPAQTAFLPASYRDIAIRYLNFPNPDYSIDYAVITAKNNDDYLIISNSREQMFGIIDVLLGFGL